MARHVIAAIVAMDENRAIGFENKIPWHLPEDMKRFAALTKGHAVLMGRNTWESLPEKYRPLPERLNIVCSRNPKSLSLPSGVLTFDSPEGCIRSFLSDAIPAAPSKTLWVIGGEQVYRATMSYWTELYLTLVHSKNIGDAFFPEFEQDFSLVENDDRKSYSFRRYVRTKSA